MLLNVFASMELTGDGDRAVGRARCSTACKDIELTSLFFARRLVMSHKTRIWTFAITSVALFMVTLDNLVVTTALPVIRDRPRRRAQRARVDRQRLHADLRRAAPHRAPRSATGSAAGACSRSGSAIFTAASAAAALAPSIVALDVARAVQGARRRDRDAADADDPLGRGSGRAARRSRSARGAGSAASPSRSARSSAAPSSTGISWHWIFWLNVPIGLVLVPLALLRLDESYGPARALDLPGLVLVSSGLLRDRLGPRPRQRARLELARDRRRARRRRAS